MPLIKCPECQRDVSSEATILDFLGTLCGALIFSANSRVPVYFRWPASPAGSGARAGNPSISYTSSSERTERPPPGSMASGYTPLPRPPRRFSSVAATLIRVSFLPWYCVAERSGRSRV